MAGKWNIYMLAILWSGSLASCVCGFRGAPGIVKVEPGGQAVLEWNLSEPLDIANLNAMMRVSQYFNNGTDKQKVEYTELSGTCNTYGDARLSCILPEPDRDVVGIDINGVTLHDASNYVCAVEYGVSAPPAASNNDSILYVFQPPVVQIEGDTYVSEGSKFKLMCSATSQSQPTYAVPPVFVYSWNVENPTEDHTEVGNNITIDSVNTTHNGATFSCSVWEEGSSLASTKTVTLVVFSPTSSVHPDPTSSVPPESSECCRFNDTICTSAIGLSRISDEPGECIHDDSDHLVFILPCCLLNVVICLIIIPVVHFKVLRKAANVIRNLWLVVVLGGVAPVTMNSATSAAMGVTSYSQVTASIIVCPECCSNETYLCPTNNNLTCTPTLATLSTSCATEQEYSDNRTAILAADITIGCLCLVALFVFAGVSHCKHSHAETEARHGTNNQGNSDKNGSPASNINEGKRDPISKNSHKVPSTLSDVHPGNGEIYQFRIQEDKQPRQLPSLKTTTQLLHLPDLPPIGKNRVLPREQ